MKFQLGNALVAHLIEFFIDLAGKKVTIRRRLCKLFPDCGIVVGKASGTFFQFRNAFGQCVIRFGKRIALFDIRDQILFQFCAFGKSCRELFVRIRFFRDGGGNGLFQSLVVFFNGGGLCFNSAGCCGDALFGFQFADLFRGFFSGPRLFSKLPGGGRETLFRITEFPVGGGEIILKLFAFDLGKGLFIGKRSGNVFEHLVAFFLLRGQFAVLFPDVRKLLVLLLDKLHERRCFRLFGGQKFFGLGRDGNFFMLFQKFGILQIQKGKLFFQHIAFGKQSFNLFDGGIAAFGAVTDVFQFALKRFQLFFQFLIFYGNRLVFLVLFADCPCFRLILLPLLHALSGFHSLLRLAFRRSDSAGGKADSVINHAPVPVRILLFHLIERVEGLLIEGNGLLVSAGNHFHFPFFKQLESLAPEIPELQGKLTVRRRRPGPLRKDFGSRHQSGREDQRQDASIPKCVFFHLFHSFVPAGRNSAGDSL